MESEDLPRSWVLSWLVAAPYPHSGPKGMRGTDYLISEVPELLSSTSSRECPASCSFVHFYLPQVRIRNGFIVHICVGDILAGPVSCNHLSDVDLYASFIVKIN